MDFNFKHPHPIFKSLQSAVTPVTPDMHKQRQDFPEIHFMTIKAVQSGGKFQLEAPWGGILDRVSCVDHTIAGYLKPGMTVCVRYSQADRNDCYIRNLGPATTAGPSTIVVPEPPIIINTFSEWMQTFAGPSMHSCGIQNIVPQLETTFDTLEVFDGTLEELRGLNRTLGVISAHGKIIHVAYRRNPENTLFDAILVKAFNPQFLTTPDWTYVIEDFEPRDTDIRNFSSNVFWDPDAKLLHIMDSQLWTVPIPSAFLPTSHQVYDIDCALISGVAWKSALCFSPAPVILKYTDAWVSLAGYYTGDWAPTGEYGHVHSPARSVAAANPYSISGRCFAFDRVINEWVMVTVGTRGVELETNTPVYDDNIQHVPAGWQSFKSPAQALCRVSLQAESGAVIKSNIIEIGATDWESVDLNSLLSAAGDFIDGEVTFSGDDTFTKVYEGVMPDNTEYTFLFSGGFLTYARQAHYFAKQMVTLGHIPLPLTFSEGSLPNGVIDSQGRFIFAMMEPAKNVRYHGAMIHTPTNLETQSPNENNGIDHRNGYFQIPTHTCTYRTMLKWAGSGGQLDGEVKLSAMFSGFQFGQLPDNTDAIATEALDLAENVWQLAVGVSDSAHACKDVVFALHDLRSDLTEGPRPCLSICQPGVLLSQISGLGPPAKITSGPLTGSYVYQHTSDPRIRLNVPNLTAEPNARAMALIGIWTRRTDNDEPSYDAASAYRADIYIYNVDGPASPTLIKHQVFTQSSEAGLVVTKTDFDRLIFTDGRIIYPSNSNPSEWRWREIKP